MLIPCENCGVQYETVITGDQPMHVCDDPNEENLIGHYIVKVYAHDDFTDGERKQMRDCFNQLHDQVQSVFVHAAAGNDGLEHDLEYEVTNEMPWDGD